MANEIGINIQLTLDTDSVSDRQNLNGLQFDQSVARRVAVTQVLSTDPEPLDIPFDLETPGFALFRNISETATVYIGDEAGLNEYGLNAFATLKPGYPALIPLTASAAYYAVADEEGAELDFVIYHA